MSCGEKYCFGGCDLAESTWVDMIHVFGLYYSMVHNRIGSKKYCVLVLSIDFSGVSSSVYQIRIRRLC